MASLAELKKSFLADIGKAESREDLEKLRVKYLGRERGLITAVLRSLKDLPLERRKVVGPEAQALKKEIEKLLKSHESRIMSQESSVAPRVDLTAPGKRPLRGHLHPLTLVEEEIRKIFLAMGFSVVEGPEVETEYYNFDALNIPADHPARDEWDTFWLKEPKVRMNTDAYADRHGKSISVNRRTNQHKSAMLLRTHTSPVQIRFMEKHTPPFQIIAPGRVFRYEATDASHEINFYQLEGLMVGKSVTLANFKFVVEEFFRRFFRGQRIDFRYRPSYFPFTEPSVEVDIKIADSRGTNADKHGKNLRKPASSSRHSGWLEVMGAGMVHPRVFEYAHYNPRDWQGFAFGMGIDRLAMIKYKIPDIRMFYSGDLRLVRQF